MRTRSKRFVSIVSVLAVLVCLVSGFAVAKPVSAASVGGGLRPPYNPPPPKPPFDLSLIIFQNVGISSSFPQGTNATVNGSVILVRSSVQLKVTLKKYYNSYSAYTVGTYSQTIPYSGSSITLQNTSVIRNSLNLKSRPAGHYQLVIEATENGKTISTTLNFYIT